MLSKKHKSQLKHNYSIMPFRPKGKYCISYEILPIMFKGDDHVYWRVCADLRWQELFSSLAEAYKKAKRLQRQDNDNRQIGINAICSIKLRDYFEKSQTNRAFRKGWQLSA